MRTFKNQVAAGERAQMQEMARRWLQVERRLDGQMTALAYEMTAITEAGGTVSPAMLATNRRYQELMIQLRSELDTYTDYADRTISNRQAELIPLGINHAEAAIITQGITTSFNRLPVSAVEHMVGLTGAGTPLHNLLVQSWPLSAQGLTTALVEGVALGYNPRKTARNMAQGATGSLNRMMVISRTETLRVYKETNRQSYRESGLVIGYRRLSTHDRRCCAACIMAEGTFYALDEEMPEHPQGRCTMIPVVTGAEPIDWLKGEDWFVQQDQDTQQSILGPETYDAWKRGAFPLSDLVTVKPNAVWGPSLQVTPLKSLGGPRLPTAPTLLEPPASLRPAGTPVSGALTVGKGKNKVAIETAISAIDTAHGDGNLAAIPINQTKMTSQLGYYQYDANGKALKIAINTDQAAADAAHTFTHEAGHYIDQQVLKISGQRTNRPEVQAWQDAVTNSRAVKQLQEWHRSGGTYRTMTPFQGEVEMEIDRTYTKYLLRKDELWARSYAQYVQYKTRDPLLTTGLRQSPSTMGRHEQWDDDDFAPIADTIDKLLQAVGWLQ